MGDIVWSINPRNDHAGALTQRMRRFSGSLLEASGITLHFNVSGAAPERHLDTDTRRQVYLIFKESINNAARHSHATEVAVTLKEQDGDLLLEVADNGDGFPPNSPDSGGNGFSTMRARAESIGGQLDVQGSGGAKITLRVPLHE
jgi:signal transduction histidine kinase